MRRPRALRGAGAIRGRGMPRPYRLNLRFSLTADPGVSNVRAFDFPAFGNEPDRHAKHRAIAQAG